jgi:hypothetical protein
MPTAKPSAYSPSRTAQDVTRRPSRICHVDGYADGIAVGV